MKVALATLTLLTAISAVTAHALDIKARDGRAYRDVVIFSIEPDGLHVSHRDGITTLDWRDLPAALQKQFHYDAAKGRRNPKAAAQEVFDAYQRALDETRRAETERLAAIRQAEQKQRAAEEQRERTEDFQAGAVAGARLRAAEDSRQRERGLERVTAPARSSLPADSSFGIVLLLIGAVIAIAFVLGRSPASKSSSPPERRHPPQLSPWLRAIAPAGTAAKWGAIAGTLSVFRPQLDITIGGRIVLALVFSIAVAWLVAVPVYLIATVTYCAQRHYDSRGSGHRRADPNSPPPMKEPDLELFARKADRTTMFGLFKKRIPAPESERAALVKRLFLARCEGDPMAEMMAMMMGVDPKDMSGETLMQGAAEATIPRVVEQFLTMRDQGATEEFAVKTLNQMHSAVLSMAGEDLSELQRASTLFEYVRHVVDAMHSHGGPISDHFLIDAIQEVESHYKR